MMIVKGSFGVEWVGYSELLTIINSAEISGQSYSGDDEMCSFSHQELVCQEGRELYLLFLV